MSTENGGGGGGGEWNPKALQLWGLGGFCFRVNSYGLIMASYVCVYIYILHCFSSVALDVDMLILIAAKASNSSFFFSFFFSGRSHGIVGELSI